IKISPLIAQIGPAVFTGWLSRRESRARKTRWEFDARTPRLSLEEASLWFAALGHRSPLPILDLIPGLSSLVAGRRAGRTIFASLRAQGAFESPLVTFRSTRLRDVRAGISISGRVAVVHNVSFRVGGGQGRGSGEVNFKRAPVRMSGKFSLQEGRLTQFVQNLPPVLWQVRGVVFATGHFATRGLSRQEMSTNLLGEANLRFKNISFGQFDPLQAVARAASFGALQPERSLARLSSALLKLRIAHRLVHLQSSRVALSGATFDLKGDYRFGGATSLLIRADLNRVTRRWESDPRKPLMAGDPSRRGALPVLLPENQLTGGAPRIAGPLSFPHGLGQEGRVATLRLAGPLNGLALVRGVEQAKLAPH
ncbi:MAG: AsmA-like C-terminal region-containing protein, partial [Terriglobia bacterium]